MQINISVDLYNYNLGRIKIKNSKYSFLLLKIVSYIFMFEGLFNDLIEKKSNDWVFRTSLNASEFCLMAKLWLLSV